MLMFDIATDIAFDELERIIENLPSDSSEATRRSNLLFIDRLGKPECITSILNQLLNNSQILARVASRSYRHVNHFDKIVLVDSEHQQGYRLTLHLWNPPYTEKELNDELIHDHRFSFWSNILTGNLECENFSRSDTGSVFRRYQYTPEKRTLSNFYTFVGEETIVKTKPSTKIAGQSYYLSYETIHRVILPKTSMTCTLVLRGPRQRNYSNILNTMYPTTNVQVFSSTFSPDELKVKISELLASISTRLALEMV
jgi:hypothetical protein